MPLCASLNVFPYHDGGFRVLQGILGRSTQGKIVEEKLYRPGALKKRLLADGGRDNSVENQPSCARHGIVGDYFQGARAVLLDHSPAAALHAGGAKIEGIHLGVFLQELTDGAVALYFIVLIRSDLQNLYLGIALLTRVQKAGEALLVA